MFLLFYAFCCTEIAVNAVAFAIVESFFIVLDDFRLKKIPICQIISVSRISRFLMNKKTLRQGIEPRSFARQVRILSIIEKIEVSLSVLNL